MWMIICHIQLKSNELLRYHGRNSAQHTLTKTVHDQSSYIDDNITQTEMSIFKNTKI